MSDKKLGFGLMRLPVTDPNDEATVDIELIKRMVDTFLDRGFDYFDTAYMYNGFQSEIAAREALVKRHAREDFRLASKMPTMFLQQKEDQERIFNEQLEKCGVDYFDYYMMHNLNIIYYEIAEKFASFDFLQQKKKEGKIKKIGFSYHDNAELLDKILTEHPEVDFVQLQLNYMDWDDKNIQSRGCYEVARKHNKSIIVMEPIKGGTLANVNEEVERLFKAYNPDLSVASWAIRYAASLEGVETVLSGMSTYEQLLDNTGYMQNFQPLVEEEYQIIKEAAAIIRKDITIPCTDCHYCMEKCPQKIPIATYFSLYNEKEKETARAYYVQQAYYDNHTKNHSKASDCIECGQCEDNCPQHIEIVKYLKEVAKSFEAGA